MCYFRENYPNGIYIVHEAEELKKEYGMCIAYRYNNILTSHNFVNIVEHILDNASVCTLTRFRTFDGSLSVTIAIHFKINNADDVRKVTNTSINRIRYKRLNIRERLTIKLILDRVRDVLEIEYHMKQYNYEEKRRVKFDEKLNTYYIYESMRITHTPNGS